ncbi:MAG: HAMP domain-containing histidine kinase [Clostridia bacterium]|nr:HAMP domain-containing histidine kinase [Clostridia bacterium]
MKKKKLLEIISAGISLFFILSIALNYTYAYLIENDKFERETGGLGADFNAYSYKADKQYIKDIAENSHISYAEALLFSYSDSMRYPVGDYPFVMALYNEEGNYIWGNTNYIRAIFDGDYLYIGLDKHIRDELKSNLEQFIKDAETMYEIRQAQIYFDGEEYIPVSMTLRGFKNDEEETFTFYQGITEDLIELNSFVIPHFYGLDQRKCDAVYYEYLRNVCENEVKGVKFDSGGKDGTSDNSRTGHMGVEIDGRSYILSYAFKFNLHMRTLTAGNFEMMSFFIIALFLVVGLIIVKISLRLFEKNKKLEEAKSTFISAAAHELKTPLAVMQNQCECIIENISPDKNEEYLTSIYDETLRMNTIVSALLSYNRISQLTEIKKEKCNLSDILREETEKYKAFAESVSAELAEEIADGVYALCNAELIRMEIDNYLSNAVKYAVADKRITVRLKGNNNSFTLEVINPAEGESANIAQESWYEFSRGDKSRQRKGTSTGMGLPICKRIFELHGFEAYCTQEDRVIVFGFKRK